MIKRIIFYSLGFISLFLLAWYNLLQGPFELSSSEVLSTLFSDGLNQTTSDVIFKIRLPRVLMAIGVGASLGLCGYLFQLVVKNPLADPYILGTSTGAALGANLVIAGFVGSGLFFGIILPSIGALIGGFLTTMIAIFLAMRRRHIHAPTLLLAG